MYPFGKQYSRWCAHDLHKDNLCYQLARRSQFPPKQYAYIGGIEILSQNSDYREQGIHFGNSFQYFPAWLKRKSIHCVSIFARDGENWIKITCDLKRNQQMAYFLFGTASKTWKVWKMQNFAADGILNTQILETENCQMSKVKHFKNCNILMHFWYINFPKRKKFILLQK